MMGMQKVPLPLRLALFLIEMGFQATLWMCCDVLRPGR